MKGLTFAGIIAFVSMVLSYFFVIPEGLKFLVVLGAVGSITGSILANLMLDKYKKSGLGFQITLIIVLVAFVITILSFVEFFIVFEQGLSGSRVIFSLSFLLALAFLGLSFLSTFGGVKMTEE